MKNYYWLYPSEVEEEGVAYAPENVSWDLLYQRGRVLRWEPISFNVRDGVATDYLANNVGWSLCSPRLRHCLESYLVSSDDFQWLPVNVLADGQRLDYAVLHAVVERDFLDNVRSKFAGDHVIKPVLDAKLIGSVNIFLLKGTDSIYVSEPVKNACDREHVTGIKFIKAPCEY